MSFLWSKYPSRLDSARWLFIFRKRLNLPTCHYDCQVVRSTLLSLKKRRQVHHNGGIAIVLVSKTRISIIDRIQGMCIIIFIVYENLFQGKVVLPIRRSVFLKAKYHSTITKLISCSFISDKKIAHWKLVFWNTYTVYLAMLRRLRLCKDHDRSFMSGRSSTPRKIIEHIALYLCARAFTVWIVQ